MSRIPFKTWFGQVWPWAGQRHAVLADYATIGAQHKHFLADLALRGFVFSDMPAAADIFEHGKNEGRRQLALEIITLCNIPPQQLFDLVPRREDQAKENRT